MNSKIYIYLLLIILFESSLNTNSIEFTPIPTDNGGYLEAKNKQWYNVLLTNDDKYNNIYHTTSFILSPTSKIYPGAIINIEIDNLNSSNYHAYILLFISSDGLKQDPQLSTVEESAYGGAKTLSYHILEIGVNWSLQYNIKSIKKDTDTFIKPAFMEITLPNKPNSTIDFLGGDLPANVTTMLSIRVDIEDYGDDPNRFFNYISTGAKVSIVLVAAFLFYNDYRKRKLNKEDK